MLFRSGKTASAANTQVRTQVRQNLRAGMEFSHFPTGEEHRILIDLKRFMIAARRSVPVFGLSIACCCVAWAQPDGPGGPPPDGGPPPGEMQQQQRGPGVEHQLKRLTELLTLTAEQQTQVKAILTDQHHQMEALFKPASGSSGKASSGSAAAEDQPPSREAMEAMRGAMKAIHADTQAKIAALLTDDQKTKFAVWEQKRAKASARQESDEMPPPPPDGEGAPPPDGGGGPGGGGPGGGGPPGD